MLTRTTWIIALALIAFCGIAGVVVWPYLPDPAPIHWNIRGEVDGYGPRAVAAFLGAGLNLFVFALLAALPAIGPMRQGLEESRVVYNRLLIVVLTMLTAIHLVVLTSAAGWTARIGTTLAIVIGLGLAFIGNAFGKIRRNFYVGIRTPWTLANDEVWERTHKAGGKWFVAHGLITAAAAMFVPEWVAFAILIGGTIGGAVWAIVYSLVIYRRLGQKDDLAPTA